MNGLEILFYWFIWCSSVLYAFYCFIIESQGLRDLVDKKDFTNGWLFNRFRDISDYEWSALRFTFIENYHWLFIHCLLTQLISRLKVKYLPHFFIIYSSLAIIQVLSPMCLMIIWFNILLSLIIHSIGNQLLCYLLFMTTLFLVHNPIFISKKSLLKLNERQSFLFEVSIAWLNAKCLSLSIDRIRSASHKIFNLNDILVNISYCLYLPALFTGPIHQYSSFINDFRKLPLKRKSSDLSMILKQLIRFTFWTLVLEVLLHFVYSSSIQYYPEISEIFNIWTLCGLGFALPLIFFVKYFVIYGSVATIAMIDGIQMPSPPKCISRIHLCSYLWRTFDRGLHLWLTNYFYKPIIGSNWNTIRKIFAGFVCFACICLWHGMDSAVLVWSSLNFFGVSSEIIASSISSTHFWNSIKYKLSNDGNQRLNALIASPFFAIAFISNIFFLSNWEVGYCFVNRILLSFPVPLLPTLLIMYCGCHVSSFCETTY